MKPVDVKSRTYVDLDKENNEKDPKSKVVDHVRIPKYKKFFQKSVLKIGQKRFL